jgi:hypothetical protein
MVRGRRLKKSGDLEVQKQNVASSKQTIGKQNVPSKLRSGEQNVAPSELKIDESSNICDLKVDNGDNSQFK